MRRMFGLHKKFLIKEGPVDVGDYLSVCGRQIKEDKSSTNTALDRLGGCLSIAAEMFMERAKPLQRKMGGSASDGARHERRSS